MNNTAHLGQNKISQSSKKAFRNPWVLGWIALVVTVVTVNTFMISMAVVTNPGLVEENYYERGQDHEQNFLTKKMAIQSLGWETKLDLPETIALGAKETYRCLRSRISRSSVLFQLKSQV